MFVELKKSLANVEFRSELIFSIFCWLLVVAVHPMVLEFVEFRSMRIPFNDWLLNVLPCANLSIPIFILLYGVSAYGIYSCIQRPALFLLALQSYMLVQLLRLFTMILVPFDSPLNLEPLRDPLLELTFYKGNCYTRDLFFSGHVATMVTFYLLEYKPIFKKILLLSAILMSAMILIQHIHYTVDVAGGWAAAYFCNYVMVHNKNFVRLKINKLFQIWKP
jgi:hypothetical protein